MVVVGRRMSRKMLYTPIINLDDKNIVLPHFNTNGTYFIVMHKHTIDIRLGIRSSIHHKIYFNRKTQRIFRKTPLYRRHSQA